MNTNLNRLTEALKRNEELTKDLESIVQNTTASLLEHSAASPTAFVEPEFHKKLDMGKVRLHVTLPGGTSMVVPCDHRDKIAAVIEDTIRRSKIAGITEFQLNGAAINPADRVGDIVTDGDRVSAFAVSPGAPAASAASASGSDSTGEVDMPALMSEIANKLRAADEALRARAEVEKRAKIEAEAVLAVFKSVAKDKEDAIAAISSAAMKMLNAECVTVYFVHDQMSSSKQLRVARSVTRATVDDIGFAGEEVLHAADTAVEIGNGQFIGTIASPDAKTKADRFCCVAKDSSSGKVEAVVASPDIEQHIDSMWDASTTLQLGGPNTPAGFSPNSMLAAAVTYTAPSKNMVTFKSDEELMQVFRDVDEDESGSIERDELKTLGTLLGKRLTEKELDEAMNDMDTDKGGQVDVEEFKAWWQDAYQHSQVGNVVGVIELVNRADGQPFDEGDVAMLSTFVGQIGHLVKEYSEKANLALAVSGDAYLAQFQDQKALRKLKQTKESLSPRQKFKTIGVNVIKARRLSVEFSPAEMAAALAQTQAEISESTLLVGLSLPKIEELQQWSFPSLDYTVEQLIGCVVMVFRERNFFTSCMVSEQTVMNFTSRVFAQYNNVPYHNFYHAFSVFQGCYWALIKCQELRKHLTTMDQFALLCAAICHDIDHQGTNNAFHVQKYDELALLYNDQSCLENKHARKCFETSKLEGCDIFGGLEKPTFTKVRGQIIGQIIQTDMAFHAEKMNKLDKVQEFQCDEDLDKNFWMESVLHGLDIGNVAYKWEDCYKNARMCVIEFKAQVALERKHSLKVSDFMDNREDFYGSTRLPALAKSQVGFGNFVVKPCLAKLARHLPIFTELVETLEANIGHWKEIEADDGPELPLPTGAELKCLDSVRSILEGA